MIDAIGVSVERGQGGVFVGAGSEGHVPDPDRARSRPLARTAPTRLGWEAPMGLRESMDDPEEVTGWEHVRPRKIGDDDWKRFESYIAEIFQALGMDLATPGTHETPAPDLRAMCDSKLRYEGDHKLLTAFPTECRGGPDCRISQIIEGPISFFALCEHHALPFHGIAHVGYIAHEHI